MASLHVIPGAVTRRTLKALVLGDAREPMVWVEEDGGVATGPILTIERLSPSARFAEHLGGIALHVVRVSGLEAGRSYEIVAEAVGAPTVRTAFRTPGDAEPLRIVVASCYFDGSGAADKYLAALRREPAKGAAFKLLVGDNLYLDVYDREFDDPWKDVAELYRRHFLDGRYADVLACGPTLTTFDDHEFWNNYPHEQAWLKYTKDRRKAGTVAAALEAIDLFQLSLNPDRAADADDHSFEVSDVPHVSFFVADVRTQRERATSYDARMMPEAALVRLERWAAGLDRPGILVLGQPLWMRQGSEFDFHPPRFRRQYERIWAALAGAPFDMLVVSGDVHHSRLLACGLDGDRRVFEFVSSPARHIPVGAGELSFPTTAPFELLPGFPRLDKHGYVFGTDIPGTIGVLVFTPAGNAGVSVGAHFLDLDKGGAPAASLLANLRDGRPYLEPVASRCTLDRAFTLRRRPPLA